MHISHVVGRCFDISTSYDKLYQKCSYDKLYKQIHNQIIFPSHFGIYYSYPTVYLFRENGDILRWKKICNIDFHGLLIIDL